MDTQRPIPIGGHTLPPLPYSYDALEPVIDANTVTIHHDKHHKKYVDDLNATELALAKAREQTDWQRIGCLENLLAFNSSGHVLHSVYWTNMTRPGTGGTPLEHTLAHINWHFGGMEPFVAQFTAAASQVQGSGWAILGYHTAFGRLELLQCEKHQNLTSWGTVPLLVCDVWEHAYYLKYQNDRGKYISDWWQLVNWQDVETRFIQATGGILPLRVAD